MSNRVYPGFSGIPDEKPLSSEQRESLRRIVEHLDLRVANQASFLADVLAVAEHLQRFHTAGTENTIRSRLANVRAALAVGQRGVTGPLELSAPNRHHYSMLTRLRPEACTKEKLELLQRWLKQQRPGRGTRPQPERANAVLQLRRVWQAHGLGRPPSTHHSPFAQLLAEIFACTIGPGGEGEPHNLIHRTLTHGAIVEESGYFMLVPPDPRK